MSDKITNNVRAHRKRGGLTQEDLAKSVGVSRQTIISIERGRYIPSLPLALKIAGFFRCSTDEMFQLEGGNQDG
jgi:putative transcriptional regulator